MDWTPERKKRIYDEYTVQEWANWVFGMEDVGWGCMTKQEWRDWIHDMTREHGMPAKGLGDPQSDLEDWEANALPAQGQPAQGPSFGNCRILEYVGTMLEYNKKEAGTHSQSSHEPLTGLGDKTQEGKDSQPSESESETEHLPNRNWRTDTSLLFTGEATCRKCELIWVCDGNECRAGHTFSMPVWHVPFFVCPECSN